MSVAGVGVRVGGGVFVCVAVAEGFGDGVLVGVGAEVAGAQAKRMKARNTSGRNLRFMRIFLVKRCGEIVA
jgi:hypothetical protein